MDSTPHPLRSLRRSGTSTRRRSSSSVEKCNDNWRYSDKVGTVNGVVCLPTSCIYVLSLELGVFGGLVV